MRVLVTGAAGYVGSQLVPELLVIDGHDVTAFGLFSYRKPEELWYSDPGLREIKGDLRDLEACKYALEGCDAVIHLACVANDDAWALDPRIGRETNYDAFRPFVRAAKEAGVSRFIYASSSSVYGVKTEPEVTEDLLLEPLTDYSKYKGLCEGVLTEEAKGSYGRYKAHGEWVLAEESAPGFTTVSIRPGTLCGWAPGLRLDLICNMFVAQAMVNRRITVWGGDQSRALLDIRDMSRCYRALLEAPAEQIDGKVWNLAAVNMTARDIGVMVAQMAGAELIFQPLPPNDQRSYSISSGAILSDLGFAPIYDIRASVYELIKAFKMGMVPNALTDSCYYRLRRMKELIARGDLT